ncbi:MAG TPA: hypothetical protein VJQ85_03215, partial [Gaiellaceae bacterium]|nr:hypothetical protein [Gaiellaceae bacterium]
MRDALLGRRYAIAAAAAGAMIVTFVISIATSSSNLLGVIIYTPGVMLVGVDAGLLPGIAAGGAAGVFWLVGQHADSVHPNTSQIVVRFCVLVVLGFGSAVVGNLLRTSESRRASTMARQRALLDATIDGICL